MAVGNELSQVDEDVVVVDPPKKKQKIDITSKFDGLEKKIYMLCNKLSFIDDIKKVFECVICRSTVQSPVVAPCCKRIIGCRGCVSTWRATSTRCPLCSVSGHMAESFELKGIDDLTGLFRAGHSVETSASTDVDTISTGSSDDFEDLPNFGAPRS